MIEAPMIEARMLAGHNPVFVKAGKATGDRPSPKRFNAVAYSGGIIPANTASPGLASDYVVDLAGMTAHRNVVANMDHGAAKRVGHVDDVQNDGQQLSVAGVFSAATQYTDEVVKSAANGYQWQMAIDANMSNGEKLAAGKTATVNGRQVTGPLIIFRKSLLRAVSFVDHGDDEDTSVSIAAALNASAGMVQAELAADDEVTDEPAEDADDDPQLEAVCGLFSQLVDAELAGNPADDETTLDVLGMVGMSVSEYGEYIQRLQDIRHSTDQLLDGLNY